tara:strand:+ start:17942 stop:19426 length:1485 start_codon:yes stop_codon:yes gene_type:complete
MSSYNKNIPFEKRAFSFENRILFICLLLSGLIFLIDLSIPLGVAAGVPYIAVISLSFRLKNTTGPILFSLLSSILIILGYFSSQKLGIEWMVLTNRALAIFVIWNTFFLGEKLKNTKSKLNESISRFHLLTEQSAIMMWQADKAGQWTFISKGWTTFTGNQPIDQLNTLWKNSIHAEDRDITAYTYNKLINDATAFQISIRLKHRSNEYRWITLQGNVCYSTKGELTGYLGTAIDIHDQKVTELLLEEARQKYYHQEKMVTLGTLTSGILHEIGNPLASIVGLLNEINEILKSEQLSKNDKEQMSEYLFMAFNELNRLTRISQDVSSFSNLTPNNEDLIDINELISKTCRLMMHDERMWQIELKIDLEPKIPALKLTHDHLIQVLQNIIGNSIDALVDKKTDALITVYSTLHRDSIVLSISDNGIGMSSDIQSQAKQEFFTTKARGTGLGLSICSSLINKLNGSMEINSIEGEGTKISIILPLESNSNIKNLSE